MSIEGPTNGEEGPVEGGEEVAVEGGNEVVAVEGPPDVEERPVVGGPELVVEGENAKVVVVGPAHVEERAVERGDEGAGSRSTVEVPARSTPGPPMEQTAASLLGLARQGLNTAALVQGPPVPASSELTNCS